MKKTKYISLVTSVLLAVSPVITTSLTTSSVVNAAKTTHAKKHIKKHGKKVAKKSTKKSTKKTAKKSKKSAFSKIFSDYNEIDSVSKQYYRTAYNNRYTQNGKQYVDVKANRANIPEYSEDGSKLDRSLTNKAGDVFKIKLSDFEIEQDDPDSNFWALSADSYTYYNAKDFTIVPHAGGTFKSLTSVQKDN